MTQSAKDTKLWYANVPRNINTPTKLGFVVIVVAVFGFTAWASTAPIDGAVVAPGSFVATGQNKIIQHLEGGIIREILVREGDLVEAGQTLIRLDETAPKAKLRRLYLRFSRQTATEARLRAEARFDSKISFPESLTSLASDPDIKALLDTQQLTFQARQDKLTSEIAVLRQGIAAFRERMTGSQSQLKAIGEQLAFIAEELKSKSVLHKKGLLRKSEILAIQRSEARLRGEAGRLRAEIGDVKERIARTERQITRTRYQQVEKAVEELHEVESEIKDIRERIRAARNVVERIDLNAPVKGIVIKMKYHTAGGVIEPGKDILELLPVRDELIIEAQIRPQDIDNVRKGQAAFIRLTALSQRVTPMLPGEVIYVSADTLPDDKKGRLSREDIYIARIRLDGNKAAEVEEFHPTPGMPTEVYIKTGQRTFFKYLTQPIIDSVSRAFRES
ncbi:MAG: HlyD family type I secretion periplasmic adaptor subunit [Methyloligellaceae bacterium]